MLISLHYTAEIARFFHPHLGNMGLYFSLHCYQWGFLCLWLEAYRRPKLRLGFPTSALRSNCVQLTLQLRML